MEKVKSFCIKHKYGILFFSVLLLYSFFVSGNMQPWKVCPVGYSFHAVDFSIGFCTRLLPGAVCNLIFDNVTETKVSVYLNILFIFAFVLISFFLEKLITKHIERKKTLLIIFTFFLTGPATFSVFLQLFCWLDFYWLLAAILSILFLSRKELYVFVIPAMLAAIMSHYAAIICYVPFVCIFILYKISISADKKEKVYLWIVWIITVVSSLGLTVYMVVNEPGNVNYTIDELHQLLLSRGVSDFEYYDFAFYKDAVIETFEDTYYWVEIDKIKDIDLEQPKFVILAQMIIQQFRVNMELLDLKDNIVHLLLILPIVLFLYKMIHNCFAESKHNKLKRFSLFCSMSLFVLTMIFGILFSTDTIRWISHATTPLFAFFFILFYYEGEHFRENVDYVIEKLSLKAIIPFLIVYISTVGIA